MKFPPSYLLVKLTEEATEVAHRALKQLQFGKDEVQAGQEKSNATRLVEELRDLRVLTFLLEEAGEIPPMSDNISAHMQEKLAKLRKYYQLSLEKGQAYE